MKKVSNFINKAPNSWWVIWSNLAIFILCMIMNVDLFLYLLFFVFESLFGFIAVYMYGAYKDIQSPGKAEATWAGYLFGCLFFSLVILLFGYVLTLVGYSLSYGADTDFSWNYYQVFITALSALLFMGLHYCAFYLQHQRSLSVSEEDLLEDMLVGNIAPFLVVIFATVYWLIFGGVLLWLAGWACLGMEGGDSLCSDVLPKNIVLFLFISLKVYFHLYVSNKEDKE